MNPQDIVDYLIRNLGDISQHGPSKIWLTQNDEGTISHTYDHNNITDTSVGGEDIPILIFDRNNRLFEPMIQSEIIPFLMSFGLDRHQAEEVLASHRP